MKVAFFDIKPFEEKYLEENLDSGFEKYYYSTNLTPDTKIEDNIKDVEIISVFIDSNLSYKVLSQFKNLKAIVLRSTGFSHVDLAYTSEHNITVYTAPHYGDHSIAEHTFALLLAVSRNIVKSNKDIKENNITEGDVKYQGIELCGKTIGIVGLGATGKIVADIALGFSMKPVYYDIKKDERYNDVSFDELCKISDIISINCPLNQNTIHMFNENKFSMMKEGVIIINTARGEIIKTKALYEALLSKKVKFAALDVVECENILYENSTNKVKLDSIKDCCYKNYYLTKKIMNMDNVILTPHIAYDTTEAKRRILEITVQNLISSTKFTN